MKYNDVPFKSLLSNIVDNRGKTCPTADIGIPLIATNCIKNDALYPVHEKVRYVSEDTYDTWFRAHPQPGDMVFVTKGSPGRVCWVPDPIDFCIAQDMVAIRANEDIVYPKFLFALLRSSLAQNAIENMYVGTLIPHFKKGDFDKLILSIPDDIDYQKRVGDIYFTLSEKIELNRQINHTLEQIAQAIFKSWFVDFDPVKAEIQAKEQDRDTERAAMETIAGKAISQFTPTDQLAATAALFPDELVESELGLMPKGWEVAELGTITSELRRGISPKYTEEGGVQIINQKCIRNHSIDYSLARRNDTEKRKIDGREVQVGDVLINSTGVGTLGRLAPVRYLLETTVADSHVTVVRALERKITSSFLEGFLLAKESFIESSGAGSTGQTELRRQVVAEIKACIPNYRVQELFQTIAKPIGGQIAQNEQQQNSLAMIRDTLLPKLLAGEIELNK